MRILHLEASPGWGGQEMRIVKESLGLKKRGHEVFLGVVEKGLLIEKGRENGLEVFPLKLHKKKALVVLFQIMNLIKKKKIDLVVTHSSVDSWLGGMAARLLKKPVVRMRHLSTPIRGGLNGFLLYNKLCDAVVTTSAVAAEEVMKRSARTNKELCLEVATGIDPSFAEVDSEKVRRFRESLSVKETDFLVGTACFMRSWKGINDFLKAALLLKDHTSIKWVIIGGGHMEEYIERARLLKLDNVLFTGHLNQPNFAIAALDLFALISTAHEGVSQSLLQAALLKKPLIGTPTGGIPEICRDNVTGILVPRFSPEKVAEAVLKIQKDQALAKKMGSEAYSLVKSSFTLEHMLDQMEEVYTKVCL